MKRNGSIAVGLADTVVDIGYNNELAYNLAALLFQDLYQQSGTDACSRFDVVAAGPKPMLSLWQEEKRYYFGLSRYQLAYILVNEVLYHCIVNNRVHLAIHAGAVSLGNNVILLPGKSGSGKSTLAAMLLKLGYEYLSDELVLLGTGGRIIPFTRPLSFKPDRTKHFLKPSQLHIPDVIADEHGAMIPHRMFNPIYRRQEARLTHIVFPRYTPGAQTMIIPLSPARSCQKLMESFVNARNFEQLGIRKLSELVRSCRSFEMHYGETLELDEAMSLILSP